MPGKQYSEIAAVLVGENGETHTINLCERCFNLNQKELKQPEVAQKWFKRMISEERSRGKLAVGMGKNTVETKTPGFFTSKKIYAKNLLKDVTKAWEQGKKIGQKNQHAKRSWRC